MKKIILGILLTSLMLCNVAIAADEEVYIEGSTTVLPIAQLAAEEFMDRNSDIEVIVKGGGSGVGITSLIENRTDIADASRAIKDAEIVKALTKKVKPKAHVVAMDGIAVILHPSNKIKNLSKDQLKAIYTGKVTNWESFGGADQKIVVISRDSASGTYEAFNELALSKAKVMPGALLGASNKAVLTAVATSPGAIGYVGLGYVTNAVKTISVNGVECNVNNVLVGKYPLARPLFMYTNGEPTGAVKKFMDFVLSKDGQSLVEEVGYIKIK